MERLSLLLALAAAALVAAGPAQAQARAAQAGPAPARDASVWGRAVLASCDKAGSVAVFEGRVSPYRHSARMQMRFTLQVETPDDPVWRKVKADGFGVWIAAPAGAGRYIYDKTVKALVAPGSYRAAIEFRWRGAAGKVLRSEKGLSPACRLPDPRPDLHVRALRADPALSEERRRYVAVLANRGRGAAGAFDVAFYRAGELLGTVAVAGLEAGAVNQAVLAAPACLPGEELRVVLDPGGAVDEADEADNVFSVSC